MAPWIQNVAATDIKNGYHIPTNDRAVLISITDPAGWKPQPMHQFSAIHYFEFLDVEERDYVDEESMKISDVDAEQIVAILQQALEENRDVVVHCMAGVCRSGAVAEVGVIMGFRDAEAFRAPNLLVKHKLMRVLGLYYDSDEAHTINGEPVPEDWTNDNEKIFTLAKARRKHRETKKE